MPTRYCYRANQISITTCRVVYLNSILSSHGASFHPGVEMGTSELLGKPDEILGCVLG